MVRSTLSVIIPEYNNAVSINQSVDIVSRVSEYCDYRNETIIVDDGSVDESATCCDSLALERGITVIHQKNSGVSGARNKGIDLASGEYILFIDADDTIDPQRVAGYVETMVENRSVDMLVFGMSFDYYHNNKCYRRDALLSDLNGSYNRITWEMHLPELFKSNSLSSLCSRIIKRSILQDNNLHLQEDMFFYEDLEFVLRVLNNCDLVYFANEPAYFYHIDDSHTSSRIRRLRNISDITDKIEIALSPFQCDRCIILESLTKNLLREKINDSDRKEVKKLCEQYQDLLGYSNARTVLIKRTVNRIRHNVANFIKCTVGDFRKW